MVVTRKEWAAAARLCVGTPYSHAGRLVGVGLDCAGVVVATAMLCGLRFEDRMDYSLHNDNFALFSGTAESVARLYGGKLENAYFAAFDLPLSPLHIAVVTPERTLIHVHYDRLVVEEPIPSGWRSRVLGLWTLHGAKN